MSTTLILPGETEPLNDADEIRRRLEHQIDAVIDGGSCGMEPTTVVHLEEGPPRVSRQGKGPIEPFLPHTVVHG